MFAPGKYCFIPDNESVFKLALITDFNATDNSITVVDYEDHSKGNAPKGPPIKVKIEQATPIGSLEELEHPPADLIKLQEVHRPSILHTLRSRFQKDEIYTSIGPILVALNPFKWIRGIYDQECMMLYKSGTHNLSDQPHVFAISHEAYSELSPAVNQSLIISGESGAGKTEATKQCLNYFAFIAGSSSGIQSKILQASPILEAWGNSKTLRNNNSSRFGKYIEIWFDKHKSIIGASNTTYILEKSRVVRQDKNERNYHVFYQLLQGATPQVWQEFHLISALDQKPNMDSFHYMNQSGCIQIEDVDDTQEFHDANNAFKEIGFTPEEQHNLYRIVAGILHLGNINFTGEEDESKIDPASTSAFEHACDLFGLRVPEFKQSLLFRKIQSGGRRNSIAWSNYKVSAAYESRDALAKEIYRRCFDWIVSKINVMMFTDKVIASSIIGVLDIFGFEIFQKNSFEQLCINLANEALQQHFNYNIFQAEMDIYLAEDVPVPALDFKDNQDVLDLIMKKPKGLIPMLDEEGIVPRGSWEGFYSKFTKQHTSNPRAKFKPKTNELGVVHYAGEVYYDPSLFLVKNKDTLSQDLIEILSLSDHEFISALFDEQKIQERESGIGSFRTLMEQQHHGVPANAPEIPSKKGSDSKQTVGRKFSIQLEALIANLNSTKPRYIRCIKPNQVKKPNIFVHHLTNEQLTYSGVFEAVIIMQNGYPFRLRHDDFRVSYQMLIGQAYQRYVIYNQAAFNAYKQRIGGNDITRNDEVLQEITSEFSGKEDKSVKLRHLPCNRDQCRLMVLCIEETLKHANPKIDMSRFFVGLTKVFYQANENRILREVSSAIKEKAAKKLTRQGKRYIAQKLVKLIFAEEKKVMLAMTMRDMTQLQQSSAILEELQLRMVKSCGLLSLDLHIVNISSAYRIALETERNCVQQITTLDNDAQIDEDCKYQQLLDSIKVAKGINFKATHKGLELLLHWLDNKVLVMYDEKIKIMGLQLKVKKQFASGIAEQNEFVLEDAVKALNELKALAATKAKEAKALQKSSSTTTKDGSENLVVVLDLPADYCVDLESAAQKIIDAAAKEYEEALSIIMSGLGFGKFITTRQQDEIQISVDIASLSYIMKKYNSTSQDENDDFINKKKPAKIELLLSTCDNLLNLRTIAKDMQWEQLWQALQKHWLHLAETHGGSKNSKSSENMQAIEADEDYIAKVLSGEILFLPEELKGEFATEIKHMTLACVNHFVIPPFAQLLESNPVPSVVYYCTPLPEGMINLPAMKSHIQSVGIYQPYFDEHLKAYLQRASEHISIRQAIISGERKLILDTLASIKHLNKTLSDVVNAFKYQEFYDVYTSLSSSIIAEHWQGQAGFLKSQDVKIESLSKALSTCKSFAVIGNMWQEILHLSEKLLAIRTDIVVADFKHAEQTIQGTISTEYKIFMVQANEQKLPEEFRAPGEIMVKEIQSYISEIRHVQAFNDVVEAYAKGCLILDIEKEIQSEPVLLGTTELEKCLEQCSKDLIQTARVANLLQDLYKLIAFRKQVVHAEYPFMSDTLLAYYESSKAFSTSDEVCRKEFFAVYQRYMDYQCRTRLANTVPIQEVPEEGSNQCQLYSILCEFPDSSILSQETRKILLLAKALFILRCALRDGYWEPDSYFSFGRSPTHLLMDLFTSDKDSAMKQDSKAIEKTIVLLRSLETMISIAEVNRRIELIDIKNLSVVEIYYWLKAYKQIPPSCELEIEDIVRQSVDRRCRVILLMGACTGKCHGTIEKLNHKLIKIDSLRGAISFAEENKAYWSETTANWVSVAQQLLAVRDKIIKFYGSRATESSIIGGSGSSNPSSPSKSKSGFTEDLHDVLLVEDIETLIASAKDGFPLQELKLVLNKINDLNAVEELTKAVQFGGPTFQNGKFDVTRVQHLHLVERLEAAKKLPVRSDRLDRLFFYFELLINLRLAVSAHQWDLSERGEQRKSHLDRNVITVKRCFSEYAQAEKFFRTVVPGVPPDSIKDEFRMVEREWERRLILQRFTNAYKSGAIVGTSYALMFSEVRTDLLQIEIDRVKALEAESNEVDKDVQVFVQAAEELIAIRQEAKNIQAAFRSKVEFSEPTNSIKAILSELSFIPSAVKRAVDRIDDIKQQQVQAMTMIASSPISSRKEVNSNVYANMEKLVARLKYCYSLPVQLAEVELLVTDLSERQHANEVLKHFITMTTTLNGPVEKISKTIDELIKALQFFYQRQEKYNQGLAAANKRKAMHRKQSSVLEYIHDSAVVIVHFFRAKLHNFYDGFHRDWKIDVNFNNTPRMLALRQQLLDGKYTMQQLIRATQKYRFHANLVTNLRKVELEIEDQVSEQELKLALCDAALMASGRVGSISIPDKSISFAESVISRIDKVGFQNPSIKSMKTVLEIIVSLRTKVRDGLYHEGMQAILKYLRVSNKDLVFFCTIVFESADTLSISSIAKDEFILLAKEICDNVWKIECKQAIIKGKVSGKRGNIASHLIDYKSLDSLLECAEIIKENSNESVLLTELSGYIRSMRYAVLASAEGYYQQLMKPLASSPTNKSNPNITSPSKDNASPTATTVSFSSVLQGVDVSKFVASILEKPLYNIAVIAHTNLKWTLQNSSPIETIEQSNARIFELFNQEYDYFNSDKELKSSIADECDLILKHIRFLQATFRLEQALNSEFLTFSPQGLTLSQDYRELQRFMEESYSENYELNVVHEFWSGQLLQLAKLLTNLLIRIGWISNGSTGAASSSGNSGKKMQSLTDLGSAMFGSSGSKTIMGQTYTTLLPGSKGFQSLLTPIASYLQAADHMIRTFQKKPGSQKRSFPFPFLLKTHQAMNLAIQEYASISTLSAVAKSEEIFYFESDNGQLIFNTVELNRLHLHEMAIKYHQQQVTYDEYATAIVTIIEELPVSTIKGLAFKDYTKKLVKFRAEVKRASWYKAKVICNELQPVLEYDLNSTEKERFTSYVLIIQAQRILEYNIYKCILPEANSWTVTFDVSHAIDIIGSSLQKYFLGLVDGSIPPLPKYKLFEELTEIANRVLELLESVRSRLWISQSDLTEFPDHKSILPVTYLIGEDVYARELKVGNTSSNGSRSSSPVPTNVSFAHAGGNSVLTAMVFLQQSIQRTIAIPVYLKTHLQLEMKKIEYELITIQLEQMITHTLEHVQFVNLPGELIISDYVDMVQRMCKTLETYKTHMEGNRLLKQGWLTGKLVLGIFNANRDGQHKLLGQYMEMIAYFIEAEEEIIVVLSNKSSEAFTQFDDTDKLLMLEEEEYRQVFQKSAKAYFSMNYQVSRKSKFYQDYIDPQSKDNMIHLLQDKYTIPDEFSFELLLREYFQMSTKDQHTIRYEIQPYLPLLFQHYQFELLYAIFEQAITDMPAQGTPGELVVDNINYEKLEAVMARLVKAKLELRGYASLLQEACEALIIIRSGQSQRNYSVVLEGVTQARSTLLDEQSYEAQSETHFFGGKVKHFLYLASKEIDLAELDMQQVKLIQQLQAGLASTGVSDQEYPFDLSQIQLQQLMDAFQENSEVVPTCHLAQDLQNSAKIVHKVRKLLLDAEWKEAIEFIKSHYHEENDNFDIVYNQEELHAAWKIASVSYAVGLAENAFKRGRIEGNIKALESVDLVDVDNIAIAKKAFDDVKDDWLNEAVRIHACTCDILHQLRYFVSQDDTQALFEYSTEVMEQLKNGDLEMIESTLDEIKLAEGYSTYQLVMSAFSDTLNNGKITGRMGHLEPLDLNLEGLKNAYLMSKHVSTTHEDIDRMQASGELIYRIRRAQARNCWIKEEVKTFKSQQEKSTSFALWEPYKQIFCGRIIDTTIEMEVVESKINHSISEKSFSVEEVKSAEEDQQSSIVDENFRRVRFSPNIVNVDSNDLSAISIDDTFEIIDNSDGSDDEVLSRSSPVEDNIDFQDKHAPNEEDDELENWEGVFFSSSYHPDESVEDLLDNYEVVRSNKVLDPLIFSELELAHQEMRFRQIMLRVLHGLTTDGYKGIPGDVCEETDTICTKELEEALDFAKLHPTISQQAVCMRFIRDAQLLYDARTCRLASNFSELEKIVQRAEFHNSEVLDYRASLEEEESNADEDEKKTMEDMMQPILPRVWEEIKLLKFDALFQIALFEFVQELQKEESLGSQQKKSRSEGSAEEKMEKRMTRSSTLTHLLGEKDQSSTAVNESAYIPPAVDYDQRIEDLEVIHEFTKNAASGYPSAEFERLLEALAMGLKLRKFVKDHPNRSPQHIIDQVAKAKTRDKKREVTCYMSLLIFEISKMSNVLDFPVLLEQIQEEIRTGRKYMERAVGKIHYDDIKIEALVAAYQAALPSLEIMGTDENHAFMKSAKIILDIRKAMQHGDLTTAMKVAVLNEDFLSSAPSIIQEEVKRLRIEMENFDAGKLLSYGLKTGRYLDVAIIAKLKSAYEYYQVEGNEEEDEEAEIEGKLTRPALEKRGSTRASRRVSQGIADMMYLFEKMYLEVEDGQEAVTTATSDSGKESTDFKSNRSRMQSVMSIGINVEASSNWHISPKFIETVKSSIFALKRAVSVTSRVSTKSHMTEYYLGAAKVILRLRESIITNKWDTVQEIVSQSMELPEVAMEEINAVREGLLYQRCLEIVSHAILQGYVSGPVFQIDFQHIEYQHLEEVVDALEAGSFQDSSASVVIKLAKKVIAIRKFFLKFASKDSILSKGEDLSNKLIPRKDMNDAIAIFEDENLTLENVLESFASFEKEELFDLLRDLALLDDDFLFTFIPDNKKTLDYLFDQNLVMLSDFYWMNGLVEAMMKVRDEVVLIKRVLTYRDTFYHLQSIMKILPIPVLQYIQSHQQQQQEEGNKKAAASMPVLPPTVLDRSVEMIIRRSHAYEGYFPDHSFQDGSACLLSDFMLLSDHYPVEECIHKHIQESLSKYVMKKDRYFISLLQETISLAQNYLFDNEDLFDVQPPASLVTANASLDSIGNPLPESPKANSTINTAREEEIQRYNMLLQSSQELQQLVRLAHCVLDVRTMFSTTFLQTETLHQKATYESIMSSCSLLQARKWKKEMRVFIKQQRSWIRQIAWDELSIYDEVIASWSTTFQEIYQLLDLNSPMKMFNQIAYHQQLYAEEEEAVVARELMKIEEKIYLGKDFLRKCINIPTGLQSFLMQAEVLLRLRRQAIDRNWTELTRLVTQYQHYFPAVSIERLVATNQYLTEKALKKWQAERSEESDAINAEEQGPCFELLAHEWNFFYYIQRYHVFHQKMKRLIESDIDQVILADLMHLPILSSCPSYHVIYGAEVLKKKAGRQTLVSQCLQQLHHLFVEYGDVWKVMLLIMDNQDTPEDFQFACMHEKHEEDVIMLHVADSLLKVFTAILQLHWLPDHNHPLHPNHQSQRGAYQQHQSDEAMLDLEMLCEDMLFREFFHLFDDGNMNPEHTTTSSDDDVMMPFSSKDSEEENDERFTNRAIKSIESALRCKITAEESLQYYHHPSSTASNKPSSNSVFHILYQTNWNIFPHHIQRLFSIIRNKIMEIHAMNDVMYYLHKGKVNLDSFGNVIVSDLYLQYLNSSLQEIDRIHFLVDRYSISFTWSDDSKTMLRNGRLLYQLRHCLIHEGVQKLQTVLKQTLLDQLAIVSSSSNSAVNTNPENNTVEINVGSPRLSPRSLPYRVDVSESVQDFLCYSSDALAVFEEIKALQSYVESRTLEEILFVGVDFIRCAPVTVSLFDIYQSKEVKKMKEAVKQRRVKANLSTHYQILVNIMEEYLEMLTCAMLCGAGELLIKHFSTLHKALHDSARGFSMKEFLQKTLFEVQHVITVAAKKQWIDHHNPREMSGQVSQSAKRHQPLPSSNFMFTGTDLVKIRSSSNNNKTNSSNKSVISSPVTKKVEPALPSDVVTIEMNTEKIIVSICEVLYFFDDRINTDICLHFIDASRRIQAMQHPIYHIACKQEERIPFELYRRLLKMYDDLTPEYRVLRPHWVMLLMIVLFFLRCEVDELEQHLDMEDNALALDVQILLALLHVPPHLTDFFREVQIGQYLADNKAKENNSQGTSAGVTFDRVSSRTIELESNFYPRNSPDTLTLLKYLTLIRRDYIDKHQEYVNIMHIQEERMQHQQHLIAMKKAAKQQKLSVHFQLPQEEVKDGASSKAVPESTSTSEATKEAIEKTTKEPQPKSLSAIEWMVTELQKYEDIINSADHSNYPVGLVHRSKALIQRFCSHSK